MLEWQKLQDGETNNNHNNAAIVKSEPMPSVVFNSEQALSKQMRTKRNQREGKDFTTVEPVSRKFSVSNHLLMIAPNQQHQPTGINEKTIKKEVVDDVLYSSNDIPVHHRPFSSVQYSSASSSGIMGRHQSSPQVGHGASGIMFNQNALSVQIDGKLNGEPSSKFKLNSSIQDQPTAKVGRSKRKTRGNNQTDDKRKKV